MRHENQLHVEHLELLQTEKQRWAAVLARPAARTHCCHHFQCSNPHCPGRPDRPPHTVPLQTTNSDGSDARAIWAAHVDLARNLTLLDWKDELRFWGLVACFTVAFMALFSLFAGYLASR